ncbi:Cu2+-exporting ATPase [Flavobacteriaceae bacterium MAR_2010_188]|nr:Cu2+-exporting ATPase [Flavobacteriaceae bacterium MAR_2010_188]
MKHTYHVGGMTCNGCRTTVEKTLNSVNGVEHAEVDLKSETAVIESENEIDLSKLKDALSKGGGHYSISEDNKN